jgi:hypothetical protein
MVRINDSKIENCELHVKVEGRTFFCFILKYSPAMYETKMGSWKECGRKRNQYSRRDDIKLIVNGSVKITRHSAKCKRVKKF